MDALGPEIDAGTPLIFLEPSCAAVFRDEMLNLFPNDQSARRLSEQTFLFDEYLKRSDYQPHGLEGRRAILHGHCHQKALMGMSASQELLGAAGLKAELLDSGCCGMAGSFGYESRHYEVSMKVGEHALLPRVRNNPEEDLIIADGFSCREQIAQSTDRRALHISEVLAMGLRGGAAPSPPAAQRHRSISRPVLAGVAASALIAGLLIRSR